MSYPTSIRVVRFVIHETGTYNEQYRRPYASQLTAQGLNQILENVEQSPTINTGIFSGLSSQILSPTSTYESTLTIPNGWSERRFRFMLHLEVAYKTGGTIQEIVTGWSETPASTASLYGTLDPNTIFRVNATMHIRNQVMNTPLGAQTQSSVADCSHVLTDGNWSGIHTQEKQITMRPSDIFSKIIVSGVENELSSEGSYDASTVLSNVAKKSKRTNGIATDYITDIVRSFTNADSQLGIGQDPMGAMDALSIAQSYSRENSAARDPFLDSMASLNNMTVTDVFSLADLSRLDPNAKNNTLYIKMGVTEQGEAHVAGRTSHWGGSDIHTHVATILSNSVPSIMMANLITNVAFITTNTDLSGRMDTRVLEMNGFVNHMDMTQAATAFVAKLEHEILKELHNNQIGFAIQMEVDLLGETKIVVNLNGEQYDYVTPSFCDALFVPVITTNNFSANQLANDLGTLMTNISDFKNNHTFSGVSKSPALTYGSLL